MLHQRLAATFISLVITGAAFGHHQFRDSSQDSQKSQYDENSQTAQYDQDSKKEARCSRIFSVLHAVTQAAIKLGDMAEERGESALVKAYARAMSTANAKADAKLLLIAKKHGIDIVPLDPQTKAGKSLLDRAKGEAELLGSLEGDAWDKEFMTLVTNTQQSVIRLLKAHEALATDEEAKAFIGDLKTVIENRLRTAQDIMAKVYGDEV